MTAKGKRRVARVAKVLAPALILVLASGVAYHHTQAAWSRPVDGPLEFPHAFVVVGKQDGSYVPLTFPEMYANFEGESWFRRARKMGLLRQDRYGTGADPLPVLPEERAAYEFAIAEEESRKAEQGMLEWFRATHPREDDPRYVVEVEEPEEGSPRIIEVRVHRSRDTYRSVYAVQDGDVRPLMTGLARRWPRFEALARAAAVTVAGFLFYGLAVAGFQVWRRIRGASSQEADVIGSS